MLNRFNWIYITNNAKQKMNFKYREANKTEHTEHCSLNKFT